MPDLPHNPPARRIVSPLPIELKIVYNEMTGRADFGASQDLPFLTVLVIFLEIILGMARAQMGAPGPQKPV